MDQNKKGSCGSQRTCHVCKIDFVSNADYALHEFSKKHCVNLIRVAKHKPIITKHKTKSEVQQIEKEAPKVNTVTHTGSFAKYGYFVPGEIYRTAEVSKEFNTDYDPYLQKFAENPYKEESTPIGGNCQASQTMTIPNISFNKKKKKKIKMCQICNVTLSTVPEYEAHMRSPQHIWKLKMTGMGVSAHFVKASTDLHTTDLNEEFKFGDQPEENYSFSISAESESPSVSESLGTSVNVSTGSENSRPFPLLYCSDCELLLNSPQQYNSHVKGKSHLECAQKKAELKVKKVHNPMPNKLYCYSCQILLNNLFQYNEHKNGKKHKAKCRMLIKRGITIPPEERVPGLTIPKVDGPIVYPELYEKFVSEKQADTGAGKEIQNIKELPGVMGTSSSTSLGIIHQNQAEEYIPVPSYLLDVQAAATGPLQESNMQDAEVEPMTHPDEIMTSDLSGMVEITSSLCPVTSESPPNCSALTGVKISDPSEQKPGNYSPTQFTIVVDKPLLCSICDLSFTWQSQFDKHLSTEDHMKKILEHKLKGSSESELLEKIISDRNVIKPEGSSFTCSMCNITTNNRTEFEQHLNSILHKYTYKDYIKKRTVEVKHLKEANEEGLHFCRLCNEGWKSLSEFVQHLHFMNHKSTRPSEGMKRLLEKRKSLFLHRERLKRSLKKRQKSEKNSGAQTKIGGLAIDSCTGAQAAVPNLESLELAKNANLGVSETPNARCEVGTPKPSNLKKRRRTQQSNQKQNRLGCQPNPKGIPPLIPPTDSIPPLMAPPLFQHQPQCPGPNYFPRTRFPYSSPYPPAYGDFCDWLPPMGSDPRARWLQRSRWPHYLSGRNYY